METSIDPLKQFRGRILKHFPDFRLSCVSVSLECYLAPRPASSEKQEMSEIHLRQSVFPWCLQRLPQEAQGKLMRGKFVS